MRRHWHSPFPPDPIAYSEPQKPAPAASEVGWMVRLVTARGWQNGFWGSASAWSEPKLFQFLGIALPRNKRVALHDQPRYPVDQGSRVGQESFRIPWLNGDLAMLKRHATDQAQEVATNEARSTPQQGDSLKIDFSCPKCGHEFHVPQKFAGGKGRCKGCGATVSIPKLKHDVKPLSIRLQGKSAWDKGFWDGGKEYQLEGSDSAFILRDQSSGEIIDQIASNPEHLAEIRLPSFWSGFGSLKIPFDDGTRTFKAGEYMNELQEYLDSRIPGLQWNFQRQYAKAQFKMWRGGVTSLIVMAFVIIVMRYYWIAYSTWKPGHLSPSEILKGGWLALMIVAFVEGLRSLVRGAATLRRIRRWRSRG